MSIHERIHDRRIELGMSVINVAEALGVSRATVYRYENGGIEKLPFDIIMPLASALRTTPKYLMGWSDDPDEEMTTADNIALCMERDTDTPHLHTDEEETLLDAYNNADAITRKNVRAILGIKEV